MCLVLYVCHAVLVEGFGCRGVHNCTLVDCCMCAVLEDCGLFVYGCNLRVSGSDTYLLHCSREMAIDRYRTITFRL